jgi:carotenoid cleavage dioxygenase-like enzyme
MYNNENIFKMFKLKVTPFFTLISLLFALSLSKVSLSDVSNTLSNLSPNPNLLFTSIQSEIKTPIRLQVEGTIPKDLGGVLYRNGFGKFEGNKFKFNHLFDSLALLMKFDFQDQEVFLTTKLADSHYYNISKHHIPPYRTLGGTNPCMNPLMEMETMLHLNHDNLNANIIRIGDKLITISDVSGGNIIDEKTLNIIDKTKLNHPFLDMITSTHPIGLIDSPFIYNYESDILNNTYKFYRINKNQANTILKKEYFLEIPTKRISYIHSFSLTPNYLIFIEYPFYWNVTEILLSTNILPSMKWEPNSYSKILVINLKTNELEKTFETAPFFSFHHVNAYEEDDGNIIVDLIAYNDSSCINNFYMNNLLNNSAFPTGYLSRFYLDMFSNKYYRYNVLGTNVNFEMPSINKEYRGQNYNYLYGMNINSLIKVNLEKRSIIEWSEPDQYPSEPIYVSKQSVNPLKSEDFGYILSVVLDDISYTSYLLILDARTMTTIAKARIPIPIPLTCHGFYE